ncbi:hypothetical protein ACQEVF_57475 [Nonomuraea polychroma]|uniref:hypothetical protein n=1 Tax=Nonomuraea polychroma TaxID=46176 RepID=UPI003D93F70C
MSLVALHDVFAGECFCGEDLDDSSGMFVRSADQSVVAAHEQCARDAGYRPA